MTRSALGTPNYMAPELVQNRACSKSDIYALGVVLWELFHWKRHSTPLIPPQFERSFGEEVSNLYKSMIHSNSDERPDAGMVSQQCTRLIEELQRVSEVAKKPAAIPVQMPAQRATENKQKSNNSGWGWLVACLLYTSRCV